MIFILAGAGCTITSLSMKPVVGFGTLAAALETANRYSGWVLAAVYRDICIKSAIFAEGRSAINQKLLRTAAI